MAVPCWFGPICQRLINGMNIYNDLLMVYVSPLVNRKLANGFNDRSVMVAWQVHPGVEYHCRCRCLC